MFTKFRKYFVTPRLLKGIALSPKDQYIHIAENNQFLSLGFTLVELLIVASIITMGLFFTLRLRNNVLMKQTVSLLVADIRNAQLMALSSTRYNGFIRCGYGITNLPSIYAGYPYDIYYIYVGPDASSDTRPPVPPLNLYPGVQTCADISRTYHGSPFTNFRIKPDEYLPVKKLFDSNLEFKVTSAIGLPDFDDIFFEPPNPTTYVCDSFIAEDSDPCNSRDPAVGSDNSESALTNLPRRITIGRVGKTCAQASCQSICVYTSGKIDVVNGTICP